MKYAAINSWKCLITMSCALGAISCMSVPSGAPKEMTDAEDALKVADHEKVAEKLPVTMKTAHQDLSDSIATYKTSEDTRKKDTARADQERSEAVQKAVTSKKLAQDATTLSGNIRSWDDNNLVVLAGEYSIPDLVARINDMKKQTVAAADTGEVGSPFAKLKDVRFQGSVVFFDTGKDMINENFVPVVDEVAGLLKADNHFMVTVSGFADPRGPVAYNDALAERRAQSVANLLESQGVAKDHIKIAGMGNRHAFFKEGSEKLQLERRVDVTVSVVPTAESR